MKNPPGPMTSHKNRPVTMETRLSSHIVNITITRPHLTRRSQLACHPLSFPTLVSSYFQGLSSPWPPSPSPSLSPWPLAIIIMIIMMMMEMPHVCQLPPFFFFNRRKSCGISASSNQTLSKAALDDKKMLNLHHRCDQCRTDYDEMAAFS